MESEQRIVICPFNKQHRIVQKRLLRHILRCEKTNGAEFVMCPYNALHRIKREDLPKHLDNCPSCIEEYTYIPEDARTNIDNPSKNELETVHEDTETNWDSESYTNVIRQYATNKSIIKITDDYPLRTPYGLSEAAMREMEYETDDLISVTSSMGMGRGRPFFSEN